MKAPLCARRPTNTRWASRSHRRAERQSRRGHANEEAWVVEDDYDGEFRYDRHPVAALQGLDTSRSCTPAPRPSHSLRAWGSHGSCCHPRSSSQSSRPSADDARPCPPSSKLRSPTSSRHTGTTATFEQCARRIGVAVIDCSQSSTNGSRL